MTLKQYIVGTSFVLLGVFAFTQTSFGASIFAVFQGGTGVGTFSQGLVYSPGGTTPLTSTTSPTIGYFTATSTTATSTAKNGINLTGGCFSISGTCLSIGGTVTNIATTYPITGGPITITGTLALAFGTTTSNTWAGLQTFTNASTSLFTVSGNTWLTNLATAAGTVLAVDPTGKIIATTTSSGGVTSVTGTYPVQSTGGNTPAISLAFGTTSANTWSALQTFAAGFVSQASSTVTGQFNSTNASSTLLSATTGWITNLTTTNASSSLFSATTGWLTNLFAANASSTFQSVLTSLWIPNSTSQSPTQAGQLALDTTNDQLVIGDGSVTSVFDKRRNLLLQYATTTAWSGTTTLPSFVIPMGFTWNTATCIVQPSGATLNAQYQYANPTAYATVNATMVTASSTPGIITFSTNNTPTAQATSTISFGTPGSSPTSIGCTLTGVVTAT